jgi:endogenous inhibitor of DNA gyrase (YacG/DUF329 family)
MTSYVYRNCPHCDAEIEYEVEINEGSYPPSECPECGKAVDFSDEDDQADAMGQLIDRAQDRHKDDYA